MVDLNELAYSHLQAARESEHGRSAELVAHDHELRQTILALPEGGRLPEHNSPPAGSIQVLVGRLRVETEDGELQEIGENELRVLTPQRHSVLALEDAAFLLTTVTGVDRESD
ncbi:cupin [Gulosibacter sp. 10]|uniref:cupin n=1 Tax=Gulosibacter sp. 10 TaxID=1255570 RepID=UPI00097ED836|nr:cupin [Gulosibacter sp. 10]SJM71699.1 hypothetical protein FM112_16690 [Gulosibacter sp. 10]